MPDFGQRAMQKEIASLRRQILDQARQTESALDEARRIKDEYHRSLDQQKQRARQFDAWLGAIARAKCGDDIPIACKPGHGMLTKLDMPAMKAVVSTKDGEIELSIQDLFPQTGPFAPHSGGGKKRKHKAKSKEKLADKPMHRRDDHSKRAKQNLAKLLATKPGEPVYVVPFGKRATVIRVNADKGHATVQSGIFEIDIPLSDLEPVSS